MVPVRVVAACTPRPLAAAAASAIASSVVAVSRPGHSDDSSRAICVENRVPANVGEPSPSCRPGSCRPHTSGSHMSAPPRYHHLLVGTQKRVPRINERNRPQKLRYRCRVDGPSIRADRTCPEAANGILVSPRHRLPVWAVHGRQSFSSRLAWPSVVDPPT